MRRIITITAVPLAFAALVACSKSVSTDELETQVTEAFSQTGTTVDSVDCPEPLDAEVGATAECDISSGDESVPITIQVTEVDGNNVKFQVVDNA